MIRLFEPELARWVKRALESPQAQDAMRDVVGGTTRDSLNLRDLRNIQIPIPPDPIRPWALEVIEDAMQISSSVTSRIAAVRHTLTRFRAAVLSAACAGRLSEDWRQNHAEANTHELVTIARERRLQQLGSRRFVEPGLNPHVDGRHVPEAWSVLPLGLLLRDIKYGTSKRSAYDSSGTPILRIPNVSSGHLALEDLKFAELDARERESLNLDADDLLMIRSNGSVQLVGLTVVVTSAVESMAYAGYLMRLRTDTALLDPHYLALALASPQLRSQIELPARSTSGVHNINTQEVRGLGIALPPLPEQDEIVRRVDAMLRAADGLDARVDHAASVLEGTAKASLAKAFRGELVPRGAPLHLESDAESHTVPMPSGAAT
jgi:type I restriction enzyme S subunit